MFSSVVPLPLVGTGAASRRQGAKAQRSTPQTAEIMASASPRSSTLFKSRFFFGILNLFQQSEITQKSPPSSPNFRRAVLRCVDAPGRSRGLIFILEEAPNLRAKEPATPRSPPSARPGIVPPLADPSPLRRNGCTDPVGPRRYPKTTITMRSTIGTLLACKRSTELILVLDTVAV